MSAEGKVGRRAMDAHAEATDRVPATAPAPVQESERIIALDALRGFALFGVLMVNMQFMAASIVAAEAPVGGLAAPLAEQLAWGMVRTLFESKFVAIFSLLFGAGLVLQTRRLDAARAGAGGTYLRRLAVLAVLGLLHGTLLYMGDILLPYALLGLFPFLCRHLRPQVLFWIGLALAVMAGLAAGFMGILEWLDLAFGASGAESRAEGISSTAEMLEVYFVSGTEEDRAWIETVVYRDGPLRTLLALRATTYLGWLLLSTLYGFNTRVLALLFLGAAAMKWGLFGEERRSLHKRLVAWGLAVGLPIEVLDCALRAAAGYAPSPAAAVLAPIRSLSSIALSGAYAGAVLLYVSGGRWSALRSGLASAGRMSLTNYLSQSILANLIFCSVGLALFGELDRVQQVLLTIGIFATQMAVSAVWLRRYRMGPFEWLWRSLSYGRSQPLRRATG